METKALAGSGCGNISDYQDVGGWGNGDYLQLLWRVYVKKKINIKSSISNPRQL